MSEAQPGRILIFGVTGQLGQALLDELESAPWSRTELVAIASPDCEIVDVAFRGDDVDVANSWPALRAGDLVFACTPPAHVLEIAKAVLHAQAICIDCTGELASQPDVPMPLLSVTGQGDPSSADGASPPTSLSSSPRTVLSPLTAASELTAVSPLTAVPSPVVLACAPLIDAVGAVSSVVRVVGTLMQSASASGRAGLVALSEESIAIFNQSEAPMPGPAGQMVAFDVVPGGAQEDRFARELERVFGSGLRADLSSVRVPSFLGEGVMLRIELEDALDEDEMRKTIDRLLGYRIVEEGLGTRGLVAVGEDDGEDPDSKDPGPTGPTLRDGGAADEILVGRLRPDASVPADKGFSLWLTYDPVQVVAEHAVRIAARRFE